MIVVTGASVEDLRKNYDSVEIAGRMNNPFSMPYERRNIYVLRGRHKNLSSDWKSFKHYI